MKDDTREVSEILSLLVQIAGVSTDAFGDQLSDLGAEIRTEAGDVLTVNLPAGQWLFVEEKTRQPITAALARLMVNSCSSGDTIHNCRLKGHWRYGTNGRNRGFWDTVS